MTSYLDEVFGSTGLLATHAGFAPRAGQVALARAVDAAIRSDWHVLAEAPTGVGKSAAYLVPAIYHVTHETRALPPPPPQLPLGMDVDGVSVERAYEEGEPTRGRAIIVTANIALQEQLVRKDLPMLQKVLPWDFSYALLKGMSNYLCLGRLNDERHQRCDRRDEDMFYQIRDWAESTYDGDKSELPFDPPAKLWNSFSVSADECSGKDCAYYRECFAKNAKKKAKEADVIVTNYALFFLDMLVRERSEGRASILPPYNIAVLDEGHKAVDIARDFFGFRVTEGQIDWIGSFLDTEQKIVLHREVQIFFEALRQHKKQPTYKARIRAVQCVPTENLEKQLTGLVDIYTKEMRSIEKDAEKLAEVGEELDPDSKKRLKLLGRKANRAVEVSGQIRQAMSVYASDGVTLENIYFIEDDKTRTALCSIPISVADKIRKHLFELTQSVTVTSATLMANKSFDYIASDLGAVKARTLVAESPFAWRQQALLVLPRDVPDPTDRVKFGEAVTEKFVATMKLARGRTLGLFTSYKNLDAAYERAVREPGFRVLRQGDMPRTRLIDEFRRDVNSVLLGTESFWAGVDVQGESLSCVFIDRLPFATPDDPLMDALSEKDKDWFKKYSMPKAIIAFKQGFGRLIRTTSDRGVVVVLDKRITTKFYGRQFIESLPPVMQSSLLEDVGNFLDGRPLVGVAPTVNFSGKSLFETSAESA